MNPLLHRWCMRVLAGSGRLTQIPGWNISTGQEKPPREDRWRWTVWRWRNRLWKQLPGPCLIHWHNGLRIYLFPKNELSQCLFWTGIFEPNELTWLRSVLRPGMTVLDVGANMGLYTLFAAKQVGPRGCVVAIEPSAREFAQLQAHVAINRLANVRLCQMAATDAAGVVDLVVAEDAHAGHNTLGALSYEGVQIQGREQVQADTIDHIVAEQGLERVDVIKMDVEGGEYGALCGARETLRRFRPALLLELADRHLQHQGASSRQVWSLLTEFGYTVHGFDRATGRPTPVTQQEWYDSENIVGLTPNGAVTTGGGA